MSRLRPYKQTITKGENWNINKTKQQAMLDITTECGENKFYTRNYVSIEYLVKQALEYKIETIPINQFEIFR